MAKQLNVSLNVQANTRDAKKNLEELTLALNKISVSTKLDINDNSLKEAKQAAIDLQHHLDKAINVDTGKLDLNKFSQSLSKSGQNLQALHSKLTKIGPDGQQAFLRLAQSISQADSSALNLGSKLTQLGTTLKNTARWQISSSILHGFMGALQGAYGYAQDLNKSLNNIRIVTGYTTDQMAQFAEQANKAAKALSTSTTSYTDAALIYYQQGLSGKAVTDRVETTIKLANVSRQSAEEVSSQMTAIWNNFADGSKNLEYYADVITKLGAATASSSDEIAQGLQKFASVADTVGLSYEKATAALATVVAETRQSADVVGTAFKTMFARFQGLNLGETLEDGVTLNKYSQAIATVGVNILEANGNLKDMDTILDELGDKWNTIGREQQVALAETVAGTRQYAQFMAIMDNYDKIRANQSLAEGAEGTLQKQADIYAESWEAASKRVRAAAQGIYQDLIDDKFFITILNGFEKFLTGINNVIDGLGGLKGILLLISSIFMQKYAKEMPEKLMNLAGNIGILTGVAEKRKQAELDWLNTKTQEMSINTQSSKALEAEQQKIAATVSMTADLNQKRKDLSATEIAAYEAKIRMTEAYGQNAIAIGQEIDALNKESQAIQDSIQSNLRRGGNWEKKKNNSDELDNAVQDMQMLIIKKSDLEENKKNTTEYKKQIQEIDSEIQKLQIKIQALELPSGKELFSILQSSSAELGRLEAEVEKVTSATQRWQQEFNESQDDPQVLQQIVDNVKIVEQEFADLGIDLSQDLEKGFNLGPTKEGVQELLEVLNAVLEAPQNNQSTAVGQRMDDLRGKVEKAKTDLKTLGETSLDSQEKINKFSNDIDNFSEKTKKAAGEGVRLAAAEKDIGNAAKQTVSHTMTLSEGITTMVGAVSSLAMSINALKNIGSIWSDEDLSLGEKMIKILSSIGTLLPLISSATRIQTVLNGAFAASETAAGVGGHAMAAGETAAATAGVAMKVALWEVYLIIGAVVAVALILIKVFEGIKASSPEGQLKRAKKSAEDLAESFKEAKDKAEALKSTIDSYDSVIKKLDECTKGTKEWYDALEDIRQATMDIISEYPDLVGQMRFAYVNGVRIISNLDEIYNKAQQNANRLQLASAYANANVIERQNQINKNNVSSKLYSAAVQGTGGYTQAKIDTVYHMFDNLNQYLNMTESEFIELYQSLGISDSELQKFYIQIQDLARETENANAALKETSFVISNNILQGLDFHNQAAQNGLTDFEDQISQIITGQIAYQLNTLQPQARAAIEGEDKQKVFEEYLKTQGIEGTFAGINNGNFKYTTANGEKLEKSIDEVLDTVVSQRLQTHLEKVAKQSLSDKMNILSGGLSAFSSGNKDLLTNLLSGQLSQIDIEQFQNLHLTEADAKVFAELYNLLNPGADLQGTVDIIQNFIDKQFSLGKIYRSQIVDLGTIRENIANYNKELKSLKFGDIIQPELFNTLSEQAQSYFQIMEDGTYKLIGSAEQLQDILFKEATTNFDKNLELYNSIQNTELTDDEKKATGVARSLGIINENETMRDNGSGQYVNIAKDIEANAVAYATATETLEQLEYVKTRLSENNVDFNTQIKAENNALQDLASKYDSCKDDLKDFQRALATGNSKLIEAAKNTLQYSIKVAELTEKYGFDAKETEAYAKRLKEHLGPAMEAAGFSTEQLEKSALNAAIANQRLDRGLTSLNSNLETYKESLNSTNRNSLEWSNTMDSLKTDLADILNMDVSVLKDEFAESLLTDATYSAYLSQALNGNIKAILKLREEAANKMMLNIETNLTNAGEDMSGFMTQWNTLKAMMAESISAGEIDQTALVNSFNELIEKGKMTKEQIEAALAGLNVAADITTEYHEQPVMAPSYITYETVEELPGSGPFTKLYKKTSQTVDGEPQPVMGYVPTYSIKGNTTGVSSSTSKTVSGKKPDIHKKGANRHASGSTMVAFTDTGTGNGSPIVTDAFSPLTDEDLGINFIEPSFGSFNNDDDKKGGGDKEHHYKEKLLKEEQHRYEDIRNELASLQKSYERVAKAEELLYGKEKFDSMRKRLKMLEDEEKVARKLLEANLGKNWEYYYNKVKNGEAITKDDIANAGGYLGGDWDELTGQKGITIQYQQTENGNEINKSENINIGAIFEAAGIKWDPKIIDGFFENPEKIEDNITELEQKLYAKVDRTKEGYEEEEARIAAIIQAIRDVYASTSEELKNMNEMIDENIEYEHQRQAIMDAFPKKQLELITDEQHRYDELNKTLEGLIRQYEDLGKARERAWGKNKIQLLEQELKKLEQLQEKYEEYLETVFGSNWRSIVKTLQSGGNLGALIQSGMIGGTLLQDRQKLSGKAGNTFDYIFTDEHGHDQRYTEELDIEELLGFALEYDENGNITNWDRAMQRFDEIENARKTKYDDKTGYDQGEDQYLEQKEAVREARAIEVAKQWMERYQETITVGIDNYEKWLDNQYEQQAKFYENFRYKVDLKIEISERSLKRIEYAIKVLGDNIYKVPEIMRNWYDMRVGDTMSEVTSQANTWATAFTDAQAAYAAGDISQEDYIQTIKDAQDGLYACVDALLELNEEMREYYKNVLSRVKEDMVRITSEMDHQLDTVKHLQNVLSLLGRETDYEAIGKILEAQLEMNKNGYEVSKAQAEMYRRQVELAEQELQNLVAQGVSEEAQEEWKKAVLYPAKEALLEAEQEMQADFEAYLEVINALYENKINKIYQDSERRLSGAWGSFDQLNNAMERQRALDDEYLTKTNQIYETNVLLKKLAKDIDKTNNDSSKIRLKNFSAEIDGLQQKNKLSKSELDIAKARYEVLLAEIALEDARNAKSTVRLQRDNEGNYGYVYTADGDNISAAEDDLAKKNNDLYNLVLSQANNYTEKILQLTQERNAALKELDIAWAEGRIADEETYNKLREDINNKYNSLIEEDYESYYRALYWLDETAATDHTEAWGTSFQDILDASEDFKGETDILMHETGAVISWLNDLRAKATEEAKVGAGELEGQLKNLVEQNDALAKKMQDEVIPRSEEVLTLAQKLTAEWLTQYDQIMDLVQSYLDLAKAMEDVLKAMAGLKQDDEFDIKKDYSRSAAEIYQKTGKVTDELIQELLYRQRKEEELGGHNDKWATNEQLYEMFARAEAGDERVIQLINDVLENNAYFLADSLNELGITGNGYGLDTYQSSFDTMNEIQSEGNEIQSESNEIAKQDQEKAEQLDQKEQERSEQEQETEKQAAEGIIKAATDLQQFIGESIETTKRDAEEFRAEFIKQLKQDADEEIEKLQTLAAELAENIKRETDNLSQTMDTTGTTISTAVSSAATTISGAIIEAANAAYAAEDAADRAENAANRAENAAFNISSAMEQREKKIENNSGGGGGSGGNPHAAMVNFSSFASGGYTGVWGSVGKLAVLHEKEIVLNEEDTQNLLAAVSLIRDFSSAIDFRAVASSVSTGLNSPSYQAGSQTLEQSVTIHAEFPNATNHSEIEEAFDNLINRASQYANRS